MLSVISARDCVLRWRELDDIEAHRVLYNFVYSYTMSVVLTHSGCLGAQRSAAVLSRSAAAARLT